MIPEVIVNLLMSSAAAASVASLLDITNKLLKAKKTRIEATERNAIAAEIQQKAELIRGSESPEDASRTTREAVEQQVKVLEAERDRLTPIAAREHWVALVFAIAAGIVFIIAIILALTGAVTQAIVTLVASAAPGFLSKVFFSREAKVEERLKEISADLRESEKARERLVLLEHALVVVPVESRESVVDEYTRRMFKV